MDGTPFRIVSGGQTGVDRAALDWAMAHQLPHGGWCPAGRMAEDGTIPDRYALTEVPHPGGYAQRTEANVRDSDATLILSLTPTFSGGSLTTRELAEQLGKPWLHLHPHGAWHTRLVEWWRAHSIQTLNVAGPRASHEANVAVFACTVLDAILECRR
ncbi:MAG: putative molybdenum carrier protein [Magnetococcales bacterium]|nr:putative molybdenum carrier protein [Magnetococcales bacterium]